MPVLTINCGSSSFKCTLLADTLGTRLVDVQAERGGTDGAAIGDVLRRILADPRCVEAPRMVVHRVVHGGERFVAPTLLDEESLPRLKELAPLAPLHNPVAFAAIDAARALLPHVPHVAVFDTAFHASLPQRARHYALPPQLCAAHAIRRFGFHGLSHANVMRASAAFLGAEAAQLRIVSCHLGNGASVTAIEHGASTETSMGMTPLEGLVMGTRAGDLDPGIILELMSRGGMDAAAVSELLNNGSGLQGMTGSHDLRVIEARAASGDEACRLALSLYGHRVRKYIGAYAAVMGGVDVIVFTGGVGEHCATVRHRCLQRLDFLGAQLDEDRNRDACVSRASPVTDIAAASSRVRLLVIAADEEREMAAQAVSLLEAATAPLRVSVAVSARHAHLSQATIDHLFGKDHALQVQTSLVQRGQFAATDTVTLIGPRGRIEHVRLIGPPRSRDQVGLSRSDEFHLGVDAPVRLSGDLAGTPGIVVEGPAGRLQIPGGLICARRHVHMSTADALRLGVKDGVRVAVELGSAGRELTLHDVPLRVSDAFVTELHLDTDEANAAGVGMGAEARLLLGPADSRRAMR